MGISVRAEVFGVTSCQSGTASARTVMSANVNHNERSDVLSISVRSDTDSLIELGQLMREWKVPFR